MFMKAKSFNLQLYMHNNEIAGVSARIFFYLFQGPFSVMIFDDCHFFNSFRFGIKFAIENTKKFITIFQTLSFQSGSDLSQKSKNLQEPLREGCG